MNRESGVALCLYAVYGDPTDCKLALIRGARAYSNFRHDALPFVISLFADQPQKANTPLANRFMSYVCQLQWNYRQQLQKRGLISNLGFYGTETKPLELKHIRENHHTLCAMDGTDPADEAFQDHKHRLKEEWKVPDQVWTDVQDAIFESYQVLRQLERFCETCTQRGIKPFQNPDQSMAEFMEFLTHISRGCLFHLSGNEETAIKDFSAGIAHLTRNILDMRKAMVTTAFMKHSGSIGHSLVKKLLAARQEELSYGSHDRRKMFTYKQELRELTNLFYLDAR